LKRKLIINLNISWEFIDYFISINPKADEELHPDKIESISAPDYCLKSSNINAAMNLIQHQFPELGGFYKVQHGSDLTFPKESAVKWIQIIHTGASTGSLQPTVSSIDLV
jgi:hypothetical protein